MTMPRIALFSDASHESTGVARMAAAIETCAKRRNIPLLLVHAGREMRLERDASVVRLELKRSSGFSFRVRGDRCFDAAFWRHLGRVTEIVRWFAPDVLHFTGAGDVGQLGACVGRRLSIPMVGSWHTDIQDVTWMQQQSHRLRMLFYTVPHVILAPSGELAARLEKDTGRPTFVMPSAVNTEIFRPARRHAPNAIVNIGYVGTLSAASNVRLLRTVESELDAEGLDVRFTIVGDGAERDWLRQHMLRAEFTGVLSGDSLAQAYAQMDIFAVPSKIDTVGASVLEAMASGVPAVVMGKGGHRFNANAGDAALFAESPAAFVQGIRTLVKNRRRREMMGHDARARVSVVLSWDRLFSDVARAYDAALSAAETGAQKMPRPGFVEAS